MKNVRMQKANAMGSAPKAGSGGGNPYKYGNSGQSITGGGSGKMPSQGVPCDHKTHAKPKGAK